MLPLCACWCGWPLVAIAVLIRFSESEIGSLVVAYKTQTGGLAQVLIRVDLRNHDTPFEVSVGMGARRFPTFAGVLLQFEELKFLYPDHPKAGVFGA